jgi:hypothetical protein
LEDSFTYAGKPWEKYLGEKEGEEIDKWISNDSSGTEG